MAFFDIQKEDELTPEARRWVDEWLKLWGYEHASLTLSTFARVPRLMEVRVHAAQSLHFGADCVSRQARYIAAMLIAHARRCRGCFLGSRVQLDRLGFDEQALDGMCADPESLPLSDRERTFVRFALKTARDAAGLSPADFREMAAHGFSQEQVMDIVGFVAFWTMNMVFASAAHAASRDE